ncbi:MAG: signal peptide peptidase SppA [Bacteroidota bacterium]
MKAFLKQLLASTIAVIIGGVIVLLIVIGIISASLSSFSEDKKADIKDNSVLHIRLTGQIQERVVEDPFASLMGETPSPLGLQQMRRAIQKAKDDERIKGIYLDVGPVTGGFASFESLRRELEAFKKSDKFVYAYGDFYSEKALWLASVADGVYLNPGGLLEWNGMASVQPMLRGFLDKWGLKPMVFKVGKYKSAAENITNRELSEFNRKQIKAYLNDLWKTMNADIARSRNIQPDSLMMYAERGDIVLPEDAMNAKLVDKLMYRAEMRDKLRTKLKIDKDEDILAVGIMDYAEQIEGSLEDNKIAVIYAVGGIQYGEGDLQSIGDRTTIEEIRKAREDDDIKAVVLRVNSGGGSALASDNIYNELKLTAKKKPVIASMGDVAASGGYYIAAGCDKIFAEETTITGSIGVIGLLFNVQEFLNKELAVQTDVVYSYETKYADIANPTRQMTEKEKEKIQRGVEEVYQDFLSVVNESREAYKTNAQVDEVAQGRVWTGMAAKKKQLIDEFGGLDEAIAEAAKKAGVGEEYRLVEYPEIKPPFERLFSDNNEKKPNRLELLQKILLPEQAQVFEMLDGFDDPRKVYMRSWADPVAID